MKRVVVLLFLVACGGRIDESDDGSVDAGADHPLIIDARPPVFDVQPPPPPPPGDAAGCDDFTNDLTPSAMVSLGNACDVGENTAYPTFNGCGGSLAIIAWEIVPPKDMALSRIEIWTQGGGQVELLANGANDRPGASLFIGGTGGANSDPLAWRGADVKPPIMLRGCHRYFVRQLPAPGNYQCSVAGLNSVDVREYTFPSGKWEGPYPGHWTAKLYGPCL